MDRSEAENLINTKLNEFTLQLSEHLSQTVQGSVKYTVREVVNGKIDKIQKDISQYIDADTKWKEKVAPLIETYEAATNLQKMALTASKTSVTIVAGATATWAFFKFIVLQAIQK
jgi:hypothetical protein